MAEKPSTVYSVRTRFDLGINSGASVESIPPNQCSFASNTTYRGNYATDRPPFRKLNLALDIDALLQDAFKAGLFQGAGTYKPDFVSEQIALSLSGRLFLITPSADNSIGSTGSEITIAGDPNPATQPQTWMWQPEKFLVVNDGLSTPIIYDGVSSRRSEVAATVRGEFSAGPYAVPPISGTVDVTLTGNYTGLINAILNLNEVDAVGNVRKIAKYMVTKVGGAIGTYQVTLKNLTGQAGAVVSNDNQLIVQPSNLGKVKSFTGSGPYVITLYSAVPTYVAKNQTVLIGSTTYTITKVDSSFHNFTVSNSGAVAVDSDVTLKNFTAPNVLVGTTSSSFSIPASGSDVVVNLASQFVNPNGTLLFVGSGQFQVVSSQVNPPAAANTVTLENINDAQDLDPVTNTFYTLLAGSKLYNLPELPPARMGAYGLGRVWQCGLDGITYLGGDIEGGSSGSPVYNGRDAVLKVTENTYLAGGGLFGLPSSGDTITAMRFVTNLDTSLGQGPLQIFTNQNVFTCNAPIDRATWQDLQNPIQTESLKGAGAASQWAVTNANADLLFRSPDGQMRSYKRSRLDFNRWGNTPMSYEIKRIINSENLDLLNFCSAVEFDNRWLVTTNPDSDSHGVFWRGLAAMDFDPFSSLTGKEDAIWEGLWTGLNILQLVRFQNSERAFAICYNTGESKIEIYELLRTGSNHFDNDVLPIIWGIESPSFFIETKRGDSDLLKLENGDLLVSNLVNTVEFKVEYRADYDTCWHVWRSWSVCAKQGADSKAEYPQYRKPMGFGKITATSDCNINTGMPPMYGDFFQVRVTVKGHCVIHRIRLSASFTPKPPIYTPICNE